MHSLPSVSSVPAPPSLLPDWGGLASLRRLWTPAVYFAPDDGAGGGGNTPPADPKPGETPPGDTPPADPNKPTDPEKPDPVEKRFSQSDVDLIVAKRLQKEKEEETRRTAEIQRKAEEEAAIKNSEWEKVAKTRETTIAEVKAENEQLRAELASVKRDTLASRIAGEEKLPADLWEFLKGDTEEELRAAAQKLVKSIAPPSPGNINPGGNGGNPGKYTVTDAERAEAQRHYQGRF